MVVALGPGKFYGTSLSRPRIYIDVKLNDERVDPPLPVLDPLMSWAEEAHWSMGGLSFKRHRLQGRIEGSITKLRAEREKFLKKTKQTATDQIGTSSKSSADENVSASPPPAPIATNRRRIMTLVDEDDNDNDCVARNLGDDFEQAAVESGLGKNRGSPLKASSDGLNVVKLVEEVKGSKSRSKKLKKGSAKARRVSLRLAMHGST